jgi:hypothetical protein
LTARDAILDIFKGKCDPGRFFLVSESNGLDAPGVLEPGCSYILRCKLFGGQPDNDVDDDSEDSGSDYILDSEMEEDGDMDEDGDDVLVATSMQLKDNFYEKKFEPVSLDLLDAPVDQNDKFQKLTEKDMGIFLIQAAIRYKEAIVEKSRKWDWSFSCDPLMSKFLELYGFEKQKDGTWTNPDPERDWKRAKEALKRLGSQQYSLVKAQLSNIYAAFIHAAKFQKACGACISPVSKANIDQKPFVFLKQAMSSGKTSVMIAMVLSPLILLWKYVNTDWADEESVMRPVKVMFCLPIITKNTSFVATDLKKLLKEVPYLNCCSGPEKTDEINEIKLHDMVENDPDEIDYRQIVLVVGGSYLKAFHSSSVHFDAVFFDEVHNEHRYSLAKEDGSPHFKFLKDMLRLNVWSYLFSATPMHFEETKRICGFPFDPEKTVLSCLGGRFLDNENKDSEQKRPQFFKSKLNFHHVYTENDTYAAAKLDMNYVFAPGGAFERSLDKCIEIAGCRENNKDLRNDGIIVRFPQCSTSVHHGFRCNKCMKVIEGGDRDNELPMESCCNHAKATRDGFSPWFHVKNVVDKHRSFAFVTSAATMQKVLKDNSTIVEQMIEVIEQRIGRATHLGEEHILTKIDKYLRDIDNAASPTSNTRFKILLKDVRRHLKYRSSKSRKIRQKLKRNLKKLIVFLFKKLWTPAFVKDSHESMYNLVTLVARPFQKNTVGFFIFVILKDLEATSFFGVNFAVDLLVPSLSTAALQNFIQFMGRAVRTDRCRSGGNWYEAHHVVGSGRLKQSQINFLEAGIKELKNRFTVIPPAKSHFFTLGQGINDKHAFFESLFRSQNPVLKEKPCPPKPCPPLLKDPVGLKSQIPLVKRRSCSKQNYSLLQGGDDDPGSEYEPSEDDGETDSDEELDSATCKDCKLLTCEITARTRNLPHCTCKSETYDDPCAFTDREQTKKKKKKGRKRKRQSEYVGNITLNCRKGCTLKISAELAKYDGSGISFKARNVKRKRAKNQDVDPARRLLKQMIAGEGDLLQKLIVKTKTDKVCIADIIWCVFGIDKNSPNFNSYQSLFRNTFFKCFKLVENGKQRANSKYGEVIRDDRDNILIGRAPISRGNGSIATTSRKIGNPYYFKVPISL